MTRDRGDVLLLLIGCNRSRLTEKENEMKKQKITTKGTVVSVEYPTIRKSLTVDVSKFGTDLFLAAALHGVKQRLGDAESGKTPSEKYAMASRIVEEAFGADSWDLPNRDVDTSGIVLEAVARIKGMTFEEVEETLPEGEDDRDEKIRELRGHVRVKAEIAKIRAERAEAAAADSDEEVNLD